MAGLRLLLREAVDPEDRLIRAEQGPQLALQQAHPEDRDARVVLSSVDPDPQAHLCGEKTPVGQPSTTTVVS